MKSFLNESGLLGELLVACAIIFLIPAAVYAICFSVSSHICKQDAQNLNTSYRFTALGSCYIKQGDKYYPEQMLKHVTVGDEDFES